MKNIHTKALHSKLLTRTLLITILLLSLSGSFLRASDRGNFSPVFENIALEEGLSNYHITSICQDSLGYLWVGTGRGLNRYDGSTFKQYFFSPDKTSDGLPYNYVTKVKYCKHHIFAFTRHGTVVLNQKTGHWTALKTMEDIPEALVLQDRIFMVNKRRIFEFDFTEGQLKTPEFLASLEVNSFIESDDHFLWIFSWDQRIIYRCDFSTNQILQIKLEHLDFPRFTSASIINHQLILISAREIYALKLSASKEDIGRPHILSQSTNKNLSPSIEKWDNHTALISSRSIGLNIYDTNSGEWERLRKKKSRLSNSRVMTTFKDRDGNLWVGTTNKGLDVYHKRQSGFNLNTGLNQLTEGEFINCITYNPYENEYLFGSASRGILSDKTGEKKAVNKLIEAYGLTNIKTLLVDSRNRIWIGGFGNDHPVIYDQVNQRVEPMENHREIDNISHISEYNGEIYLTSRSNGIHIYDLEGRFKKTILKPVVQLSHLLHFDKSIICSSVSSGLYCYEKATGRINRITITEKGKELEWSGALCLKKESDSIVWIGTLSWGLIRVNLDNSQGRMYTTEDGLPCNDVTAIEIDDNGRLWLSTSYGISCMYEEGKFNNFSEYVGNFQFHRRSSHYSKEGILYFGGNDGLFYFDPDKIAINKKMRAKPILQCLNVHNSETFTWDETKILSRTLPYTSHIELTHRFTDFSIDYTTTEFLAHDHIQYAYRLQNWDNDWRVVNNQQNAAYSNLPPGRYIFEAKAKRGSGAWSDATALSIRIKPAPWLTWWAYLFYISVLIALVYLFFFLIFKSKLALSQLEMEQNEHKREKEMNEMKLRFFTNISHELRTPLSMVYDLASVNPRDLYSGDGLSQFMSSITINIGRLKRLVEQLLTFRKLEEDTLRVDIQSTNLKAVLDGIISNIGYYARQRNIHLAFEYNLGGNYYATDRDKIEKILYNLLDNALKYTREDGSIIIRTDHISRSDLEQVFSMQGNNSTLQEEYILFEIADSGVGISESDLQRIFDRFYKASNRSDYSGTGIGLNFVKRLVDLQGGMIKVESTPGSGTEFFVALPMLEVEEPDKPDEPDDSGESLGKLEEDSKLPPMQADFPEEFKEKKMLILEDDITLNTHLKRNFESNLKVYTAFNSDEAMQMVKNVFPDIIISDIMMREEDEGLRFCEEIKTNSLYSHIPIILLTAKSDESQINEGFMKGADIYITKPFSLNLLNSQIVCLLKNRARLQQHLFRTEVVEDSVERVYNAQDLNFIKRVNSIIEKSYNNPKFNVVELSKDMAINRTGFYQKFSQITQLSPSDYLRKYRIEKAVSHLFENEIPISSIGDEVGFSSRGGFYNAFRKEKGMTPSEFLKSKSATV